MQSNARILRENLPIRFSTAGRHQKFLGGGRGRGRIGGVLVGADQCRSSLLRAASFQQGAMLSEGHGEFAKDDDSDRR